VDTSSQTAKDLKQTIDLEKVRQISSALPVSIVTSIALAFIIGATQIDVVSVPVVASWVAVVVAFNVFRLFYVRRLRKAVAAKTLRPEALRRLRLSVLTSGLIWGTAGFLLFPPDSPTHQIYLAFVLAGLTTGAVISYAIDLGCAYDHILPSLLPYIVRLVMEGAAIHLSMALTVILFLVFVIYSLRRINTDLTENIRLKLQTREHEKANRAIQAKLAESAEQFRSLTELSSDWYWEQDENFRFTQFAGQTAYSPGVAHNILIGKTRWEIGALNFTEADWQAHREMLEAHKTFLDLEFHRLDSTGHDFWSAVSGRPFFDENGNFKGYRGIGRLITERKRAETQLQRLNYFDSLTGLPNRNYLNSRLSQAVSASTRTHQLGALMFIDLDNFQKVNDTFGQQAGDLLQQQVAQRLPASLRENDTVARLGADQFVVLLENLGTNTMDAARKAELLGEKLLVQLNQPYVIDGHHHTSTPSIGMTIFGAASEAEPIEELIRRADSALQQAKDAGRNTIRLFDPALQAALDVRSKLELELRLAIDRNQFVLHYQPQFDKQRHVTGVEALVRWQHHQRGTVLPGEFITLAEETDLLPPLANWILETACRQLAAWSAQADTANFTIAVNLSLRQMRDAGFVDKVMEIVRETGANPNHLKLEITEEQLTDNEEDTIAKMLALKAQGIRFSMDRFGTGQSSLSSFRRLPLDELKIGREFVQNMLTQPKDASIVRAILALGQNLGLNVIAQGVETQEQLDFLVSHACSAFQGYLFGQPVPMDALKQAYLQ
jgi:diguanylate cyclase (GGDEF)-like protein/PAS domain S-box-containing protein